MIVGTSALLAIALDEPEGDRFADAISLAAPAQLPAPAWVEAVITLERRTGDITRIVEVISQLRIEVAPFTEIHARAALEGFRRFGKGRHPAKLNFGDCMVYGFAKVESRPLLFKGDDFAQTDIQPALTP